ncbi:helix-turn-helix domain-containing protein [Streptomyces sp. NBC_01167]|uniref:helix-turn-helix domain-containing protein n=1 Tax=Streptomyces sp. NBC_01167 TaxID=2903756 RepID=UPI00386EF871|nr:helix-turn-helix domain-containing protein [Streptomyces sp. NBC_01167]
MTTAIPTSHTAVTVPDVMAALQLSRSKVYDLIRSRQLKSIKVGRCRRVPTESLRIFIETQLEEAA